MNLAELETGLNRQAAILWQTIPIDCKRSMALLSRKGLLDEARLSLIADAESQLKRIGKHSLLDVAHALELAAERWAKQRGVQ